MANEPRWNCEGWVSVRQVIAAWLYGCIQASLVTGFYVPRYLETVAGGLEQYILHENGGNELFETTPAQAAHWLRTFGGRHPIVKEWPIDHEVAVRNAMRVLCYEIEGAQ